MNRRQFTKFSRRLTLVLGEDGITRLGRTTGFTHRLREVTPHRMAIALLTSLSCYSTKTLADILRVFNALADRSVRYKPFHNQLAKPAFPTFTWQLFEHLLQHLVLRVLAPVPGHVLRGFDDILLQDGTSFAVVDALRDTFPGRFTKISPAAVELHATMSLFHDQAIRVHLTPDAAGERQFLPAPGDLRRKLLLADRGYMDVNYCRRVHHAGGAFIVRFQTKINPVVVRALVGGRERPSWGGRTLDTLRARLRARSADLQVRWRQDDPPFRLLLLWNRRRKEHLALVTNLPSEAFTCASVRDLYRLRWQIELLFKEWKSYANLHAFRTANPSIAEGLIWASLAAALLKRFVAHVTELVVRDVDISTRTAAMAFRYKATDLFKAVLQAHRVAHHFRDLVRYLAGNAQRAHPNRDRTTGRLATGLRPIGLSISGACLLKN
jgi:hypothetical protein